MVSLTRYIVCLFALILFNACSNDNDSDASNSAPVITSVAQSGYDDNNQLIELTPVTQGYPKNYYVIRGSGLSTVKKIYFNDYDTYFGPAFVTDTEIFVLLDEKTPYANGSNKLKVETKNGTVVYDFVVMPPTPTFSSFNPVNATEGDEITIYGNYFLNPVVTFGTIPATVVSSTLKEIKVKVPAGADKKYISVKTISGTSTIGYAVGTALYDDVSYNGFGFSGDFKSITDGTADQGLTYIKKEFSAWGAFEGNWSWDDKISDYKGIRISIKAEKAGTLKFIFNGDWSERNMLTIAKGWNTFVIPWAELGNPTQVQNISFQNMSKDAVTGDGISNTISIDNIGYALK